MARFRYYAVVIGRILGVYTSWPECKVQVHGFSDPIYRGFQNLEEANQFITKYAIHVSSSQTEETEFLDDHSTPLLITSSKRGSTSSTPTCMISQVGPLQREVVSPISYVIITMFGCTIFLLVLILAILILILHHM